MQIKPQAAVQALSRPNRDIRLYVLGGPDAAGSQALMTLLGTAMGPDAERIDLSPARIKDDPALLADEAASMSLFGGPRWISVILMSGGGDDVTAAVDNLLSAPAAGNPVVVVGHGLTSKSKLTKLAERHALAISVTSYPPEGAAADRLAQTLAQALGLSIDKTVAQAIVAATGADRGLMAQELEKLALYCDASPQNPARADIDAWRAIGADLDEEDVGGAVNTVLDGRLSDLSLVFANLAATATSDIRLVRSIATRAHLIARLRSHVDQGQSVDQVMGSHGKVVFWKDAPVVARQLARWDSARVARLIDRLHQLERALKAPNNAGVLVLRQGLLDIARVAASLRG